MTDRFVSLLSVLFLMIVMPISPAAAQTKSAAEKAPDSDKISILQTIKGEEKNLRYDFLGTRLGVQNWLLSGPGIMQIVYVLPQEKGAPAGALVGGALVGPDGKEISTSLTHDFMVAYPDRAREILAVVRPSAAQNAPGDAAKNPGDTPADNAASATSESPSEKLWSDLGQTGKITFGAVAGAPVLYAIVDPVQADTKTLWMQLAPLAKQDKLTLHIVPLALTTGDSIMEIATILGSDDPQKSWEDLMNGQSVSKGQTPDGPKALAFKSTVDLAMRLKLRELPFIVYRAGTGKIRILRGLPRDWAALFTELKISEPTETR